MMNQYNMHSENTINKLSLHDCVCSKMYYNRNLLILEMDWMEILSTHPNNPYDKTYQSDSGVIELINPRIEKFEIHENLSDQDGKVVDIKNLQDIEFEDLEILEFDVEENALGYLVKSFMLCSDGGSLFFNISYEKSYDMWNSLMSESWFEDSKFCDKII